MLKKCAHTCISVVLRGACCQAFFGASLSDKRRTHPYWRRAEATLALGNDGGGASALVVIRGGGGRVGGHFAVAFLHMSAVYLLAPLQADSRAGSCHGAWQAIFLFVNSLTLCQITLRTTCDITGSTHTPFGRPTTKVEARDQLKNRSLFEVVHRCLGEKLLFLSGSRII